MFLIYGIPRGFRNLRKNWRASLNSVLIVASSLAVLGMVALLYVNVIHLSQIWFSNTTVSLFLEDGLARQQRQRLLEKVKGNPLVKKAELISPKKGLESLAAKLGTDSNFLSNVEKEGIPYTIDFEIFVDHRSRLGKIARGFGKLPGVAEVVYAERLMDKVKLFFELTRAIGIFFGVLVLVSFCLIIANATRLSLQARRQEIEILHMAGAARAFIRSAFVVEGMLVALLGWLVATGLVWFAFELIVAGLSWDPFTTTLKTLAVFFPLRILAISLAVILVLGGLSSHLAVNRLLRSIEP